MKNFLCFVLMCCSFIPQAYSEIEFSRLLLSDNNEILFNIQTKKKGLTEQSALVLSNIDQNRLKTLTAYPEEIEYLSETGELQVQNSFGLQRIPISGGLPQTIKAFPGFTSGAAVLDGPLEQLLCAPNGKWLLRIESTTAARGNLILVDILSGKNFIIAKDLEKSRRFFPASWSPDSRTFVYSRSGQLYFYSIDTLSTNLVDERYRSIGQGEINSLQWGRHGDFYYIRGNAVYRVRSSLLFAQALYTSFIEVGGLVGKIPFNFDPQFDRFWPSVSSSSILLSKGEKSLFWLPLTRTVDGENAAYASISLLPYLVLPSHASRIEVVEGENGILTVFVFPVAGSSNKAEAWRLNRSNSASIDFKPLPLLDIQGVALSPDSASILLWGDRGLELWDYINWKSIATLSKEKVLKALWINDKNLVLAGPKQIKACDLKGNKTLLCLSVADDYGFEEGSGAIYAKNEGNWYRTEQNAPWLAFEKPKIDDDKNPTNRYRVYLETLSQGPYVNIPMVRNVDSVGTRALVQRPVYEWDPLDARTDLKRYKDGLFRNGSRAGRRELALSFDVVDDNEGLQYVLSVLERYKIRATFYLGGEFIRRYPESAREIASLGHECASLFFAHIDLFDSRYQIDGEFIKRGLARNEDDFFNATGRELSLLWHPPWYNTSPRFEKAAAEVGYTTTGHDVEPYDWVSKSTTRQTAVQYKNAAEILDAIVKDKLPGSIIPIRLGLNPGGRDNYLFHSVDILIEAIVKAGYDIVSVSSLIDHAR